MEKYKMMSSGGMTNCMEEFDEVRATILAILVSYKNGCTLNELNKSYYELEGRPIPWRKFGHCSTQSLLSSMPDVAKIEENNNDIIIKGIPSAKTEHIKRMVAHQKNRENPSRKTFRPSPYYPTTYPCMAFLPAAMLTKIIIFVEQHPEGVSMDHIVPEVSSSLKNIKITIENIETQLFWLSHRIYCKSYKIYPKNLENKEARYAGYTLTQLFNNNIKVSANILVSDHIKTQLEKLISKHSDGIWCEDLPNAYLNEYRVHLYYIEIGFNSVLEFASILTDVFHIVQCEKTGNFKLFHSKKDILLSATTRRFEGNQVKEMPWGHMDEEEKISTVVKHKMLTPNDVMVIGDYIEPIKVGNIECNDLNMVEVHVTEVFTPTVFWIRLRQNEKMFYNFMMSFHNFYVEKHDDEYQIPIHMIKEGLYCACRYQGLWQRAIISKVNTNCIAQIVFLDYGTIKTYPPKSLYYLHKKFSYLPSQAIPCSLFNVKPTEGSSWCETSRQVFAVLTMEKDLVAIIASRNEQKNSLTITLTNTTRLNYDIHITDELIDRKLAIIGRIESKKFENVPFEYYLKYTCEEEKRVKKIHPVVQNIDIKNEEEARKENFESRREESVEDETDRNIEVEKEEIKENDLNYNFAMDLHEWGNSANTNSVNNSINLQNDSFKNSIYKLNENLVNDNFFEAVKNSSCYVSCDRFIPWSPSGNIPKYFDYDILNLENIKDHNRKNTNIMTNTESRKENDISSTNSFNKVSSPLIEIASENIKNNRSISINDETKAQNSESSYEINNIKNMSTDGTINNSVGTSKIDTLIKPDTFNPRQKILLLKRLLNIRQVKSDSEDMSVSESKSSSDNCNSELQNILQELSQISEPVMVETEFDDTVLGQKKGSDFMDQTWVSDEFSPCSSSLNDIDQSWASEQSAKYSSLNDTDSSSHLVRKTNSALTENIKTNYLKEPLLVKGSRTNSYSKIEAPIDMLNENSLLTVTSSSNDSNSNSDLVKAEIDLNTLEEPLLKNSSTNSTSDIEELKEELIENSLVANDFKIPVFDDIDPSICSDYDIPDPLSFFR